jgi:hypothetical protein
MIFQLRIQFIRDMVYFLQDWIVSPMLNLLKRTMTYPGFEPGSFGPCTVSLSLDVMTVRATFDLRISTYVPIRLSLILSKKNTKNPNQNRFPSK